ASCSMSGQTEKSIFLSAIEIPPGSDRAAFLDGVCAGNAALRAEVEALLLAHEKPQRLLDMPAADMPAAGGARAGGRRGAAPSTCGGPPASGAPPRGFGGESAERASAAGAVGAARPPRPARGPALLSR